MSFAFPPNSPINSIEFFGAMNSEGEREFARKRVIITFTIHGRKMRDGILVKPYEPEQLWNELFRRKLLNRFYMKATTEEPLTM
jgi:hypothetical protein